MRPAIPPAMWATKETDGSDVENDGSLSYREYIANPTSQEARFGIEKCQLDMLCSFIRDVQHLIKCNGF